MMPAHQTMAIGRLGRVSRSALQWRLMVLWMLALPFQVLSVVMILVVAVTYMLIHLDHDPSVKLERDPNAVKKADVAPVVP